MVRQGWKATARQLGGLCLTGLASAGVTCAFVLAAVLLYRMTDTGSAADWFSALCNAAMAVTAFAAFVVARSWLPQLTTQEGYKEAISLINDQYIQLGPDNALAPAAEKAMQAFRAQNEETRQEPGPVAAYADDLRALQVHLQAGVALQEEIRAAMFRLDTYGLTASRRHATDLGEMTRALDDALGSALALLDILAKDCNLRSNAAAHAMRYMTVNIEDLLLRLDKAETADDAETQYLKVTGHLDRMARHHKEVFSQRPTAGQLFTRR